MHESLIELYPELKTVYGPYTHKKNGRKYLVLRMNDGTLLSKQLAKFTLEIKLGRVLSKIETVNHKDRDKTNDEADNLELLSKSEHSALDAIRIKLGATAHCKWCKTEFTLSKRQIKNDGNRKAGPFCSKVCSGIYGAELQNNRVKQFSRADIKKEYTRG